MTQAPKYGTPWRPAASIPAAPQSDLYELEPLSPEHTERDYAALMSCRQRLRDELQWGTWPPEGFTVEENRDDLASHYGEFERGEAFAYTVLSPERKRCIGCAYVERCDEINGAQLAYWLVDDALYYDLPLVTTLLSWLHNEWLIERCVLPLRKANVRGIELARKLNLSLTNDLSEGPLAQHESYLSEHRQSCGIGG